MTEFNLTESMGELTRRGSEKPSIPSEDRPAYFYTDQMDGSQPVILRGMNKMLQGYESLVVLEEPSETALEELIESCGKADRELDLMLIPSVGALEITTITDSFLLLRYLQAGTEAQPSALHYFVIQLPVNGHGTVAFQKFCGALKVPYSFAKNNPGFLNRAIFDYRQKSINMRRDGAPFDIVYQKSPVTVRAELSGEVVEYSAHPVINFLPRKQGESLDPAPVTAKLPMFSKILRNLREEAGMAGQDLKLQSYSLGYSGDNRGAHHARLIIGDSKFEVGAESYDLAVSVDADFLGGGDFGKVKVYYEALRQVCTNGAVVKWSESQRREAVQNYCTTVLKQRGISDTSERYSDIWAELEAQMNVVLSSEGLSIPVATANAMIESSGFRQALGVFTGVQPYIRNSIEWLDVAFGEVKDELFVDVVEDAAAHFRMPAHMVNFFLVEYLAGTMTGAQPFKRPVDVMNFLTFVAKTYDSKIRMEVESKAYDFAAGLKSVLVDGASYRDGSANKYLKQIKAGAVD